MQLVNSAQLIEVETAVAVTTNNLMFYAEYEDKIKDAITPGMLTGIFTSANIPIVPSPADNTVRKVSQMSFYNNDTASADVIVSYIDGANTRILKRSTLTPKQTLLYEVFSGWSVN